MNTLARTAIASLTLSAAGLSGIAVDEAFRENAYIPIPGDRWTIGFGSTFYCDGTPVKRGDKIDPVGALKLKVCHIGKDEAKLKECVTGPLYQAEYDILVGFSYQYGIPKTCASTLVKQINQGNYPQACQQYARWTMAHGKDCRAAGSTCPGVATRADKRVQDCLAAGQQTASRLPIEVSAPDKPQSLPSWPLAIGVAVFLSMLLGGYVFWKNRK